LHEYPNTARSEYARKLPRECGEIWVALVERVSST
jgi:hypothetical protein